MNTARAVMAALAGALSYSVASAYARNARSVEPFANAHGSMWAATLLVIPRFGARTLPAAAPAYR